MASESMTAADYIKHHLQNLTSLSDVTEGQGLKNIADFSFIALRNVPHQVCQDVFRLP